jgi:hypothetical protein
MALTTEDLTFVITMHPNGVLESVRRLDGSGSVAKIDVPSPFPAGSLTGANGIGIVMTQTNPFCCFFVQGGQAFRVCW